MIHIINDSPTSSVTCKVSSAAMRGVSTHIPLVSDEETSDSKSSNVSSLRRRQSDASLPTNFKPTDYTVIIGRGKQSKQNIGNKRLRVLASSFLAQYSDASDKPTKTRVVTKVVNMVRQAPGGMFVKKDKEGIWYEVGDIVAREKVGYTFRDLLADKYKSSSKSKVARRMEEVAERAQRNFKKFDLAMQEAFPTTSSKTSESISSTEVAIAQVTIPSTILLDIRQMEPAPILDEYDSDFDSFTGSFHPVDEDVELEALMKAPLFQC